MPVTPFHGGIGLAFKGASGRWFSFLLFCCTQVAIDLESGYHLLRGDWPVHRFLHTFIGAAIMSTVGVFSLRPAATAALRYLARSRALARWIGSPEIPWQAAATTAIVGCVGHVIPDSIMHSDVEPFAPFAAANPFFEAVDLGTLHLALVVLGIVGLGLTLIRVPLRARR
jgi:hypothetical protein